MNDFREYANYCELYHHGIKGMHWGIRRYQNKDGSLTEEGKRRYNLSDEKAYSEYRKGEKKIREVSSGLGNLGAMASLLGSGAATVGLGLAIGNTPAILAIPAIGVAGEFVSLILANKIGDKKVNDLKKSYNKERIEKVDKIVRDFSDLRVDHITKELKKRGMMFVDPSTKKAISDKMSYNIAENLGKGNITVKDVQKSDPKVGIEPKELKELTSEQIKSQTQQQQIMEQQRRSVEIARQQQQMMMEQQQQITQQMMQQMNQQVMMQQQMMMPHY